MTNFYRETWAEVDVDALEHNFHQFKRHHPKLALIAVVKANAYGHGDVFVGKIFEQLGADYLAVSSLDEALHLRNHGLSVPIMVLAPVHIDHVHVAAQEKITVIAYDETWANQLGELSLAQPLTVHIELETGMNRIGVRDLPKTLDALHQNEKVVVEGLYTHIHSGDSDKASVLRQIATFEAMLGGVDGAQFKFVHIANTATSLQFEIPFVNMQRVGLGLYGVNPDEAFIETSLKLLPVFSLFSKLTQVSHLFKGETVSYGGTFVAQSEQIVGTVSIGYADGWCRLNQGRFVKVNGELCPIIGRVCMDQLMIALPHDGFVAGDVVTLIGEELTVSLVAKETQTIAYEVLTLMSDRVPRVYKKEGRVVACVRARHGLRGFP